MAVRKTLPRPAAQISPYTSFFGGQAFTANLFYKTFGSALGINRSEHGGSADLIAGVVQARACVCAPCAVRVCTCACCCAEHGGSADFIAGVVQARACVCRAARASHQQARICVRSPYRIASTNNENNMHKPLPPPAHTRTVGRRR